LQEKQGSLQEIMQVRLLQECVAVVQLQVVQLLGAVALLLLLL
jgi:hypothetical protein